MIVFHKFNSNMSANDQIKNFSFNPTLTLNDCFRNHIWRHLHVLTWAYLTDCLRSDQLYSCVTRHNSDKNVWWSPTFTDPSSLAFDTFRKNFAMVVSCYGSTATCPVWCMTPCLTKLIVEISLLPAFGTTFSLSAHFARIRKGKRFRMFRYMSY